MAWTRFRVGEALVSFGDPYYGRPKIIVNAPLSAENFIACIEALQQAREAYLQKDQ